jgi:hypothetical protein
MLASFLCSESSPRTRRVAWLPTAVLAHGVLLLPRGLPTVGCVVGRAVGAHRAARPQTHTISTSTAGKHRRSVYSGAIVLTSSTLLKGMWPQGMAIVIHWSLRYMPLAQSPLCPAGSVSSHFSCQDHYLVSPCWREVRCVESIPHAGLCASHCTWRFRCPGSGHGSEKMCRPGYLAEPKCPAELLAPRGRWADHKFPLACSCAGLDYRVGHM